MEQTGTVERITFRSDETGFTVFRLATANGPVICVGPCAAIREGEHLEVHGAFESSARFGRQFRVTSYSSISPTTTDGIRNLLAGGFIAGIGPHLADLIVTAFGTDTLAIMENEPKKLLSVKGIGKAKLATITNAWSEQRHLRALTLFLQEYGVTPGLISRIHRVYGDRAQQVIRDNPYALIDDVPGIGFLRADAIAQKAGFGHDSPRRIRAGVMHALSEATLNGHCMLPREELVRTSAALLGIAPETITNTVDILIPARDLIQEDGNISLPWLHKTECAAAASVKQLRSTAPRGDRIDVAAWLKNYSDATGWKGDPRQIDAVRSAAEQSVMVLTGGPGTGKTTTLTVILALLRDMRCTIAPCAPTGRAAQRLSSVAGVPAKTIHRLLEFQPSGGGMRFQRNESNPIDADAVIVDEVSMIDLPLFAALLSALRPGTRLILVGDADQLPSVGPGVVLTDCISSGTIPHIRLTTVFRQAAASRIVTAAHEIIHGTLPNFANAAHDNCFFLVRKTPEEAIATISDLVATRIPAKYGFDPRSAVQVLTPMHRGELGTAALNRVLQDRLNPGTPRITRGETVFAAGDKVMQLRNNYDTGIFNGDIGRILSVNEDGLTVDFDGRTTPFALKDLDDLTPAYAISIHKSQGSEFEAAVIALSDQHFIMLQRNLIYTAVTRAKKLCIIVGTSSALRRAIQSDRALNRHTRLAYRLAGA